MKFICYFENFLNQRSKREFYLFLLALIIGIYFFGFHSYFLTSWQSIQNIQQQIQNNQNAIQSNQISSLSMQEAQKLNNNLWRLIKAMNSHSILWNQTLQQINRYTQAHNIKLWDIDIDNEQKNYSFSIKGYAPLLDALLFVDFIERLPLIHLKSFEINADGNFFLKFQNHKIFDFHLKYDNSTSQDVLTSIRSTMNKKPLNFTQVTQSKTNPIPQFKLEAIFNNRAKINGVWVKKGENIDQYTLSDIQQDFVFLIFQSHTIKLTLESKRIFQ